jgi:hypothetical protein
MFRLMILLVLVSACATAGLAEGDGSVSRARDDIERGLAALPSCFAGVEAGRLIIAPTTCTERLCKASRCCNACEWSAQLQTNTISREVDPARVRQLLELGDSSMDCEIAAWTKALARARVSLTPACVVR